MFKLRFAICLAVVVGTLTIMIGFVNDARPVTLLYRTVISLTVFGIAGYVLGSIVEKFLARLVVSPDSSKKDSGVPGEGHTEQQEDPSSAQFTPFTPDNLARIIKKQID